VKHLTSHQLCAFLDDALVGAPDDQTARHLASCAMCRSRYEAWCHVDDSLRELLGQTPDEHAMEQRTSWVEIAVSAERKGLPAPEFGELRIPLPAAVSPAVPPERVLPTATATPASTTIRRPVLHVAGLERFPELPYAAATQATGARTAPAPTAMLETVPVGDPSATREHAQGGQQPGYARMPRRARKGLAGVMSRPATWFGLLLVAALAAAVPLGIARFGVPEIKFDRRPAHERDASVREAVADRSTDGEEQVKPARRGERAGSAPTSRTGAAAEDPDASILFDLPALEPEDAEPDPVEASPKHSAPDHADGGTVTKANLCGEVRTTKGVPIEGARVYLTSPSRMVRTDRLGRFCLSCPPGKRTVRIESAGRASMTRTLQLGRGRLETRFTLDAAN
jgi:hypothetical protein